MVIEAAYGSWTSSITPDLFGKGNFVWIRQVEATEDGVWFVEQSSTTGRGELYFLNNQEGSERVRWAPDHAVQNIVHEYGGASFIPLPTGGVVYSAPEGLFLQKKHDDTPEMLVDPQENKYRFADLHVHGDYVFCVNESFIDIAMYPVNRLISVNLSTKEEKILATGADFYAFPRVSPDGTRIVWMQWNLPNMPWDETAVYIASLKDGSVPNEKALRDGYRKNINYLCPSWISNNEILLIHDETNFWNVYRYDVSDREKPEYEGRNVYEIETEIGEPMWMIGSRQYHTNGEIIILDVRGTLMLEQPDGNFHKVETPEYTVFSYVNLTKKGTIYCVAAGPKKSASLIKIDTTTGKLTVLRSARNDAELSNMAISVPEDITFQSDGHTIHGWFYRPLSHDFIGLPGTLPPVILIGHGGPTARSKDAFELKKQFYTSRGFAIFDVNYRGSSGYGTDFRNMLKHQWGIVDRDDMIAGAKALIDKGLVDPEKICITGQSAGGFLLLASAIHSDVFKAAVSVFGVSDLIGCIRDTEKFELGYMEELLAKYPEGKHVYEVNITSSVAKKLFAEALNLLTTSSAKCLALNHLSSLS